MAKLLVTGGAGFIGSNFIRYWLQRYPDDIITNLDALTYAGNPQNLADLAGHPRYRFVKGDICDAAIVNETTADADLIVHFAAESHVDRSIVGPAAFMQTNINGTFTLLEAARQRRLRFHHISTDEVFGALPLASPEKFNEQSRYQPSSPYAASKAAADHIVRAYHVTYGVPVTITNCSNNYGPYQHPEKFVARMITNLLDGQSIKLYGDGRYVRDWLYVIDHCRAIELVINRGTAGDTYVVGGLQQDVSNLDIARELLRLFKLPEENIVFVPDRPGHDRRYAVDWSKIERELNWRPEHTFAEWLKETVNWYRANHDWWRPLKTEAEKLYAQTGQ